jgi:hypothetical protein
MASTEAAPAPSTAATPGASTALNPAAAWPFPTGSRPYPGTGGTRRGAKAPRRRLDSPEP